MNILHIDSSVLGPASVTRELTSYLAVRLFAQAPTAAVRYRDLANDPLPHLSGGHSSARATGDPDEAWAEDFAISDALLQEFLDADLVIIGAPIYNSAIPTGLKTWIDRITAAGRAFACTEEAPRSLAGDKQVILVSARGGRCVMDSPVDFQEPYLRLMLAFAGVTRVTTIRADGIQLGPDARKASIAAARAQIDGIMIDLAGHVLAA